MTDIKLTTEESKALSDAIGIIEGQKSDKDMLEYVGRPRIANKNYCVEDLYIGLVIKESNNNIESFDIVVQKNFTGCKELIYLMLRNNYDGILNRIQSV